MVVLGLLPSPKSIPLPPCLWWILPVHGRHGSLESDGQQWSMAFSISTLGPGPNQKPLAPITPSPAPCRHAARCK